MLILFLQRFIYSEIFLVSLYLSEFIVQNVERKDSFWLSPVMT